MTTTKTEKQEMVTTLAAQLAGSRTIYVTDFTGLSVARITDLRRRLRTAGVEYVVVKNTLARRAFTDEQREQLEAHMAGPTALALAGADPAAAAKVLTDFAKEFERPTIRVGLVEGKPVTAAQIKHLAGLPSKAQLLAMLGGAMQAPMAGFVGVLNGLLYSMVGALEALKTKRAGAQ